MIEDLGSYSVGNFISFGDEVYFRLFERHFEKWWPLHPLMLALGAAILVLSWLGKTRAVAIGLAAALAFCAVTFHFRLYAELTPVGKFFGWAFLLQSALILLWGFTSKPIGKLRPAVPTIMGAGLAFSGLAIYPFLALGAERKMSGAEYFGMSPDPTICLTLGILLMCARPLWFLPLLPIPLLWAAATGGTLDALVASFAMALPVVASVTVAAAIWKAVSLCMAASAKSGIQSNP